MNRKHAHHQEIEAAGTQDNAENEEGYQSVDPREDFHGTSPNSAWWPTWLASRLFRCAGCRLDTLAPRAPHRRHRDGHGADEQGHSASSRSPGDDIDRRGL